MLNTPNLYGEAGRGGCKGGEEGAEESERVKIRCYQVKGVLNIPYNLSDTIIVGVRQSRVITNSTAV